MSDEQTASNQTLLPQPPTIQPVGEDPEGQEVKAIGEREEKKYRLTPKYTYWESLFLDKANKYGLKTFGNSTRSAIFAYNLTKPNDYGTAQQVGHDNLLKHKDLSRKYYETMGVTRGKMLEILFNKMLKSSKTDLWYTINDWLGYESPTYKAVENPLVQIQNNVQNNVQSIDVSTLSDEQLQSFIDAKQQTIARRTSISFAGDGTEGENKPPQVPEPAPQTERSNSQQ